jgi:hypothetical protein
VTCPKCNHASVRKCKTAECLHCNACEHMFLPGQPDASSASYIAFRKAFATLAAQSEVAIAQLRAARIADIRRQLAAREPCEDDHGAGRGAFMPCPGWRIDEVDGAPVTRKLGSFFITRCDACAPDDIMDDDLEQLPEAIEALRRVKAAASARAEAAKARPRDALATVIDLFCEPPEHDTVPRTVVITVLVVTDASCEDIAKAFGGVLDEADIATYQLGVAPVGTP